MSHRIVLLAVSALMVSMPIVPALAQTSPEEAIGAVTGGIIGFLIIICIGAVIGWLASLIVNGTGSGLLMDILAGVIGSIIANYGASLLGLSFGVLGSLLAAVGGAVIVLMLIKFIRKT